MRVLLDTNVLVAAVTVFPAYGGDAVAGKRVKLQFDAGWDQTLTT